MVNSGVVTGKTEGSTRPRPPRSTYIHLRALWPLGGSAGHRSVGQLVGWWAVDRSVSRAGNQQPASLGEGRQRVRLCVVQGVVRGGRMAGTALTAGSIALLTSMRRPTGTMMYQ